MVENLQRQFVPQQDGGVFTPLISYGSLLLTNYSSGWFSNETGPASPSIAAGLIDWYLRSRVGSQVPQFVGAGLWLLLTLVALICALVITTRPGRLPCSPKRDRGNNSRRRASSPGEAYIINNNSSLTPSPASSSANLSARWFRRRRREKLFALRLALLVGLFVVCTATLCVYWNYSYGFGSLFQRPRQQQTQENSSDSSRGGGGGDDGSSGSLAVAVNSAVFQLNAFIEDTLISTNSSVLEVCYEAFPSLLDLVNRMASRYLDVLSDDFLLTPLLNSFDKFLNLVKLLLGSMNAIISSRDSVISPLTSFTTVINKTREDLRTRVADVCAGSPANGVPLNLCKGVNEYLNQLTIGLDSRRIDSDSSVTIVTLLDRIFKLNVTEIEVQVNSAKSLLTGSLGLIADEITKLFNSLVNEVSQQFQNALAGAEQLRSAMVNVTQSDEFVGAFNTGDAVLQSIAATIIIIYCLTLACVAGVTIVLVYFYYHRSRWEAARNDRQMGGDGPPADFAPPAEQPSRPPLRSLTSIMEAKQETLPRQKEEQGGREWRRRRQLERGMRLMKTKPMIRTMFVLGLLFALLFLFGFALLYAGSEIQLDACTYLAEPSSTAVVDRQLNQMIDNDLWPVTQELLDQLVNFSLPLTKSMLPKNLLGVLLRDCRNSSLTIFQIYNLVNAFNLTELLNSQEIKKELYRGRDMVDQLVGGLNVTTLIPPQVDGILAVLPDFAAIIDTQDFSASIAELSKPLLTIGDRLPLLLGNLQAMVRILLDRNPSDNRAILIQHFADNLNTIYTTDYPALNASLNEMRRHFLVLQNNRLVLNLTAEVTGHLGRLKAALSNRTALLAAVARRYDEVLTKYTPELVASLNSLLSTILTRVGHCSGIAKVFGTVVTECSGSLAALPYGGFFVALSSACLVLLSIVAMPLLRAARWHKHAAGEPNDWHNEPVSACTSETSMNCSVNQLTLPNGSAV